MKREDWKPRKRMEQEYENVLRAGWDWFAKESSRVPGQMISAADFLVRYARQAALRMITGLYFEGAKTWREAARESSKADILYPALQQELSGRVGRRVRELVRENAELISSFPTNVARRVAAAAAAQQQAGGRAGELTSLLGGTIARSRAHLIARTEISKASSALTQARSESLGLPWYEWQTSQDERVRASHRKMQGVLVQFSDPPSPEALLHEPKAPQPYNAGDIYNCRCFPAPVLRPENITWPHKVYYAGRVQYMTLSKFRLIGQARRIAA